MFTIEVFTMEVFPLEVFTLSEVEVELTVGADSLVPDDFADPPQDTLATRRALRHRPTGIRFFIITIFPVSVVMLH